MPAPTSRTTSQPSLSTESTVEALKRDFTHNLFTRQAKFPAVATKNDVYLALSWTIRDRLLSRWIDTASTYLGQGTRTVAYLSAEFLMGPQLHNNLLALNLIEPVREAMSGLGFNLDDIIEHEEEPGLGNGGLGRLAACYMDSAATLQIPAIGYGLRYEFGIFDQTIQDGWQVERTDRWLRYGYPWEIGRPDIELPVGFGGRTESWTDDQGQFRVKWIPAESVVGIPYDTPVPGYGVQNCNFLRLWAAVAGESFDLSAFNSGDYLRSVQEKMSAENITKVLYPNDQGEEGKALRLKQQYLLVSCSLQDMLRLYLQRVPDVSQFDQKFAIQLNDTHPALTVLELMRLLVDVHLVPWDKAWAITTKSCAYTNHTLLPEALETWSLPLFGRLLPRHLEIAYEVNRRFLEEAQARFPNEPDRIARLSLIDESGERRIRMANLATVGSHCVNGVAALHSELLKTTVMSDFAALWPEKFTNVTNGVTPRRFVRLCNPGLSKLITDAVGPGWVRNLDELRGLEKFADDSAFRDAFLSVKRENKRAFSEWQRSIGLSAFNPAALLDVQAKRLHAYKRQHLAVLHAIALWRRMQRGDDRVPRTLIFAGKAAPGYRFAKLVIRLIHGVAEVVNNDPITKDRLKVLFTPDFSVKVGQRLYPAADLSEQLSTAGKEASGTGNMKFALNGALTIGTLDGANIEIRDHVGHDHFFLFGLTAEQVMERKRGGYRPGDVLGQDPELREVIELISSGTFSRGDRALFEPIVQALVHDDEYLLLADFRSYAQSQESVDAVWRDRHRWARSAILNVARMGFFSSDRSIRDYCEKIWKVQAVEPVRHQ
jgi:glycogen phosphorylase